MTIQRDVVDRPTPCVPITEMTVSVFGGDIDFFCRIEPGTDMPLGLAPSPQAKGVLDALLAGHGLGLGLHSRRPFLVRRDEQFAILADVLGGTVIYIEGSMKMSGWVWDDAPLWNQAGYEPAGVVVRSEDSDPLYTGPDETALMFLDPRQADFYIGIHQHMTPIPVPVTFDLDADPIPTSHLHAPGNGYFAANHGTILSATGFFYDLPEPDGPSMIGVDANQRVTDYLGPGWQEILADYNLSVPADDPRRDVVAKLLRRAYQQPPF